MVEKIIGSYGTGSLLVCAHVHILYNICTSIYMYTLAVANSLVVLCRVEHENVKERSFSFSGLTHEQLMIGKSSHYRKKKIIITTHLENLGNIFANSLVNFV